MKKKTQKVKVPVQKTSPSDVPAQKVTEMEQLIATPGWATIVEVLDRNIEFLTETILDGTDADGNDLDEKLLNRLRDERRHLIDLRDFPQAVITAIESGDLGEEDFDPYWRANEYKKALKVPSKK